MLQKIVTCALQNEQNTYIGTSNGYVEQCPNKFLLNVCDYSISSLRFHDNKLIIGTENGEIFIYEGRT